MNNTTNISAVKGFLDAQYRGDFDTAFRDFVHTDFSWIVSTADNDNLRSAIPWAGYQHNGKEGYIQLTTQLFPEFEPLEFDVKTFTDTGDRVFAEGRFVFRHRKTEKIAVSDFISRFDMQEGRILGGQFYENTEAVAAARRA